MFYFSTFLPSSDPHLPSLVFHQLILCYKQVLKLYFRLEPLLARIKESRTAVLVPIIDVIDDKTLQYFSSNGEFFEIGGFTWSGHFTWIHVPEREKKRRGSSVGPTRYELSSHFKNTLKTCYIPSTLKTEYSQFIVYRIGILANDLMYYRFYINIAY